MKEEGGGVTHVQSGGNVSNILQPLFLDVCTSLLVVVEEISSLLYKVIVL